MIGKTYREDQNKTKDQLIDELNKMGRKVAEFETAETRAMNLSMRLHLPQLRLNDVSLVTAEK